MSIRSAFGIYNAIETILTHTNGPLTCVEILDYPEIQRHTSEVSKVSDALGHMWRRGLLARVPAPKMPNSQARFAYSWKNTSQIQPKKETPAPQPQQTADVIPIKAKDTVLHKPNITISDNGELVIIDLPMLTLTIRTK